MNSLTLSFLCPAKNEAVHLPEMLDSLLAQSYSRWEALLVDDGSSDTTAEIMRRYADADARFRLVSTGVPLGKVRAFNAAYAASVGEIIALAGCDDVLPPTAAESRAELFRDIDPTERVVGYFKIRTFSTDRRYDGLLLPKGGAPSRSGGSITMTRGLADVAFPIDETLPSEDIWLAEAADAFATKTLTSHDVVLRYRIHEGNSHPRHRSFRNANESLHVRLLAYQALIDAAPAGAARTSHLRWERAADLEDHRYAGNLIGVLRADATLVERLATLANAHPLLFAVRRVLYRHLTGRRSR